MPINIPIFRESIARLSQAVNVLDSLLTDTHQNLSMRREDGTLAKAEQDVADEAQHVAKLAGTPVGESSTQQASENPLKNLWDRQGLTTQPKMTPSERVQHLSQLQQDLAAGKDILHRAMGVK